MKQNILIIFTLLAVGALVARAGQNRPGQGDVPPKNWMTFDEMDANHDGKITLDEYKAAQEKIAQERFKRVDANHDGAISKDEFEAHKHLAGQNPGATGRVQKNIPDFSTLDTDGNGSLSPDEFKAAVIDASLQRFKKIDANGDGVITRDEMDAALQSIKSLREGKHAKPESGGDKPAR